VLRARENHLVNLFVDGENHRQGIATRLHRRFEAACKRAGFDTVDVRSSLYAVPFYQSVGYKKTTGVRSMHGLRVQPMILRRDRPPADTPQALREPIRERWIESYRGLRSQYAVGLRYWAWGRNTLPGHVGSEVKCFQERETADGRITLNRKSEVVGSRSEVKGNGLPKAISLQPCCTKGSR
jgi:hypothetical protein